MYLVLKADTQEISRQTSARNQANEEKTQNVFLNILR
jgi:hypothetical protein